MAGDVVLRAAAAAAVLAPRKEVPEVPRSDEAASSLSTTQHTYAPRDLLTTNAGCCCWRNRGERVQRAGRHVLLPTEMNLSRRGTTTALRSARKDAPRSAATLRPPRAVLATAAEAAAAASAAGTTLVAWGVVGVVAVAASASALSSFTGARDSITSIESGRKKQAKKKQDRKRLARKLWGLDEGGDEDE
jgi:hypothetical protein